MQPGPVVPVLGLGVPVALMLGAVALHPLVLARLEERFHQAELERILSIRRQRDFGDGANSSGTCSSVHAEVKDSTEPVPAKPEAP